MSSLMDAGRLYVTKQDLDLDRPTAATYETLEATKEARVAQAIQG